MKRGWISASTGKRWKRITDSGLLTYDLEVARTVASMWRDILRSPLIGIKLDDDAFSVSAFARKFKELIRDDPLLRDAYFLERPLDLHHGHIAFVVYSLAASPPPTSIPGPGLLEFNVLCGSKGVCSIVCDVEPARCCLQ